MPVIFNQRAPATSWFFENFAVAVRGIELHHFCLELFRLLSFDCMNEILRLKVYETNVTFYHRKNANQYVC